MSRSPAGAFTFDFTTRSRRPPTDPVNALLSLAYSLLAKECTLAAGLQQELLGVISQSEDQVLVVSLGPSESRGHRVIAALGKPYTKLDSPCYVV